MSKWDDSCPLLTSSTARTRAAPEFSKATIVPSVWILLPKTAFARLGPKQSLSSLFASTLENPSSSHRLFAFHVATLSFLFQQRGLVGSFYQPNGPRQNRGGGIGCDGSFSGTSLKAKERLEGAKEIVAVRFL